MCMYIRQWRDLINEYLSQKLKILHNVNVLRSQSQNIATIVTSIKHFELAVRMSAKNLFFFVTVVTSLRFAHSL